MLRVQREPSLLAKHQGFSYQVEAVEAIKDLEYAAVFHEQGLGKTKIGVDLALTWLKADVVDAVLVITKRGLVDNWRSEVAQHSFLVPRILGRNRRANFHALNSPARFYITHYEVLKSERKRMALFLKTRRVGAMLDEAHKIKNPNSDVTRTLVELAPGFTRRVIMTGTPVANRPYDLWAQVYFLDHGASLGQDFASFKGALDLTNKLARNPKNAAHFQNALGSVFDKIRRFTVRETKESAEIRLPSKDIKSVRVDLEPRQAEIYQRFREECAAIVVKEGRPILDDADAILKRLVRLVQVASNPRLVDESYRGVPAKFPLLENILYEAADAGEKAIVWSSFTANVDWMAKQVAQFGAVRVHGKMTYDERNRAIESFKRDEDCKVLIATPASAKEGLTLTVANHAIFYDRSFSLDDYLQAQDRIHRISQNRPCFVTNLIAKDTIDEWVDVLLSAKHLAAKLGQGDITKAEYEANASYVFGEMIRDVLGLPEAR